MSAIWSSRRWFAILTGIATLAVVALTAGVLFAANAPQQSQPQPAVPPEPVPERVFAQPGDNQERIDLPPLTKEPPRYPNLDSNLNRLAETAAAARQPASANDRGTKPASEPALVTFHVEPEQVDSVREYLEDNGVFVRNVGEDYIEAHVPLSLLPSASERPGVLRVNTVIPPRPASRGSVISQGAALHGADAWHNAGYRGQGVKVGVIDSGFEGFSRLQGSELPRDVTARCYFEGPQQPTSRLADCEVDDDHGTAVAETLVDVAPDAALYIANPHSLGDLRNAVDWMAGQGVQVINFSLGVSPDGPGDGTSPFSDSPLRTIDAAMSSGITWVNSAGNDAKSVWYGAFSDTDNDGWHNFAPQDNGNAFVLLEGQSVKAFMRWDDTWGRADCDLDLALWRYIPDSDEWDMVVIDDEPQNGTEGNDPLAKIIMQEVSAAASGLYDLSIFKHTCTDSPAWIQLTAWIDDGLQYHSPGHHIGSPGESRNPGMLAVGATHYWDTDAIASYSSRGPTLDGRTKPDITGVACGQSSVEPPVTSPDGSITCWFAGTSQAAPHVAGLAALVKQRFPRYTPAQVVNYLQQNAAERGAAGKDNTWGYGLAALPSPQAAPTPGPTSAPTPGPTPVTGSLTPTGNITVSDGDGPGEAIVMWDAVPGATHYRTGFVNMDRDYPLAKASAAGDWIEAFRYADNSALNFTVENGRVGLRWIGLEPGARHAFTVLTSNNVTNTIEEFSGRYLWPSNPRWTFHTIP